MLNIFHKLHHVCIVVHDIQKSMAYYESVGIGPWYSWGSFSEFTELDVEDVEAQNETTYMCADIDNIQIQLCQPSIRKTPKRKFLDEHGEGVFHLGFVVDDVDRSEAAGCDAGLTVFERGRRTDRSGFSYFDTAKQAGVTLEIRANKHEIL
jgi:methylmalonyl-CoA/ethylmalonyl-CoA epimerase